MKGIYRLSIRLADSFRESFSKRSVNSRAKKTGFTRRKAQKLSGYDFLVAMTLGRFKKCTQ